MELIDRGSLYAELCRLEALARDRYLDTPSSSPASARYTAQLNERTALKQLVVDTAVVDAVPVVRCRNCMHYLPNRPDEPSCRHPNGLNDANNTDFCSYGEPRTPPAE